MDLNSFSSFDEPDHDELIRARMGIAQVAAYEGASGEADFANEILQAPEVQQLPSRSIGR